MPGTPDLDPNYPRMHHPGDAHPAKHADSEEPFMIFTIGPRKHYDEQMRKHGENVKIGRHDSRAPNGYPGGTVWLTYEDAARHLKRARRNDYGVYGVMGDWKKDTVQNETCGDYHDLLFTRRLVRCGAGREEG